MTITVIGENTVKVSIDEFSAVNAANSSVQAAQSAQEAALSASNALTSENNSLASANASAVSASDSDLAKIASQLAAGVSVENYLGSLKTFATLELANEALTAGLLQPYDIVLILQDNRYDNKSTINQIPETSILIDFQNDQFATNEVFTFGSLFGLHRVQPPLTSTDAGEQGLYALDTNYLYVAVGTNSWKRITLENF